MTNGLMSNYIAVMKKNESPNRIVSIMSRKLRASYAFILKRMKEMGLDDLDISHGDILDQLYRHGKMPMKELAERIRRDKSTLTALINKMERLDLVYRDADSDDARISIVVLTEKGDSYRDSFQKISKELIRFIYRDFSEDEKRRLIDLLVKCGE